MTPGPRILYDASLASNPAGTGSFVRGLLAGLDHHQPAVEVIASSFESGSRTLDSRHKNPVLRLRNSVRHLAYYLQTLPQRAEQLDCDLIFCPSSLVPLRNRRPFVMTVFDLTPLRFGSTQEWLSKQYLAAMLRTGIHRARIICTISQAIGDEILARFPGIEASRMRVTYPGPNPELLAADATPVPIPNRPFVLMVGTVEPRKNHLTVLRALGDDVPVNLKVVVEGSEEQGTGGLAEFVPGNADLLRQLLLCHGALVHQTNGASISEAGVESCAGVGEEGSLGTLRE